VTVSGTLAVQRGHVLRVDGGRPLRGRIRISGSKNAMFPVLAGSLLSKGPVHLINLPDLADTWLMTEIIQQLGARIDRDDGALVVEAESVGGSVPMDLGQRVRGSIVLLGALLARTGEARLPMPGGDAIGARRVEQHLRGLRAMGAEIEETGQAIMARAPRGLHGARVVLDLPTVTGTENIMLAAATARGRTEIFNAAREPHVQDLARFLNASGGCVRGAGTDEVTIEGVPELGGCWHRVIPDYLEAGTYAFAVAAAGGEVTLEASPPEDLHHPLLKLEQAGVEVATGPGTIHVRRDPDLPVRAVDLVTWAHPGFPTDLQAQYLSLMTQAYGDSLVSEYLYENRMQHVPELIRMGARIEVKGRDALVRGPNRLRGATVKVTDIRSGAALVIAALCASGTSEIQEAWHLDRGYEDLVGKLTAVGASLGRYHSG
jgi:UDP-N-acetylglucosamine 1-carboxyvinyltransferase